jgi:hypothetical protein
MSLFLWAFLVDGSFSTDVLLQEQLKELPFRPRRTSRPTSNPGSTVENVGGVPLSSEGEGQTSRSMAAKQQHLSICS